MAEEVETNQAPAAEPEVAVEPQVEVDSGEPVSVSVALFASVTRLLSSVVVRRVEYFRRTWDLGVSTRPSW